MILSMIFWGLVAHASDCTDMTIASGGYESKLNSVSFNKDETKKFCLKLPKAKLDPGQNPFLEWSSVNKGNASCGVLRMSIRRPDRPDIQGKDSKRVCKAQSVQPGCVMTYTEGKWIMKATLVEQCRPGQDRWDLGAKWSVK